MAANRDLAHIKNFQEGTSKLTRAINQLPPRYAHLRQKCVYHYQ